MSEEFLAAQRALAEAQCLAPPVVPSLEKRRLRAYLAILLADVVAILVAGLAAGWLYEGLLPHPTALLQAQLLLPIYLTIALYNTAYSLGALQDLRYALSKAALALVISTALLAFILFYAKTGAVFSRAASALALVLALALIAGVRLTAHAIVTRRWVGGVANVLIIHEGPSDFAFPGALVVDAAKAGLDPASQNPEALDRLGQYLRNQDKVIVSCTRERREAWAFVLKAAGVTGEVLSEPAHAVGAIGVTRYEAERQSALIVAMGPLGLRARAAKRLFDLSVAVPALVLLAPVMLAIALAVKLGDRGPVLFVQPRVGKGNRIFPMLKFRTMRVGTTDVGGIVSTTRADDRITAVGRVLRRTSLDELPQLWNVVLGEMSVVGPRPHALASQAGDKLFWEVDARYWHRHSLKPGLTGLAQVRGLRGSTDQEEDLAVRLQADLEYIARWNLWRDVAIMLRTLAVLVHRRAY